MAEGIPAAGDARRGTGQEGEDAPRRSARITMASMVAARFAHEPEVQTADVCTAGTAMEGADAAFGDATADIASRDC